MLRSFAVEDWLEMACADIQGSATGLEIAESSHQTIGRFPKIKGANPHTEEEGSYEKYTEGPSDPICRNTQLLSIVLDGHFD